MKIIRVAQVIGIAGTGGVESCIMNYYRHIDKTKIQFDFLVESTSKIINKDDIEKMGGKIITIPSYRKNIFKFILELKKIFEKEKYDIVHSNMNTLSVFVLYAAKKAKIKIRIAHSHSTTNKKEWKKNMIKNMLKPFSKLYATHYFACGELAGRWMFGNKTFNKGKVKIINNAIDIRKFKFDPNIRKKIRSELKLDDSFVIGHIGRFMKQKNHKFLIDIFNEYQYKVPNSVLLLVGEGSLFEKIKKMVEEKGLSDKVVFVGAVVNPEEYYQAMDCFVLPSLYEGLPVVGIEAQANGLPLLLSNSITKEVVINDNVKQLSLKKREEWILELDNIFGFKKNRGYSQIENSKYDIVIEADKLTNKYIAILEEKICL